MAHRPNPSYSGVSKAIHVFEDGPAVSVDPQGPETAVPSYHGRSHAIWADPLAPSMDLSHQFGPIFKSVPAYRGMSQAIHVRGPRDDLPTPPPIDVGGGCPDEICIDSYGVNRCTEYCATHDCSNPNHPCYQDCPPPVITTVDVDRFNNRSIVVTTSGTLGTMSGPGAYATRGYASNGPVSVGNGSLVFNVPTSGDGGMYGINDLTPPLYTPPLSFLDGDDITLTFRLKSELSDPENSSLQWTYDQFIVLIVHDPIYSPSISDHVRLYNGTWLLGNYDVGSGWNDGTWWIAQLHRVRNGKISFRFYPEGGSIPDWQVSGWYSLPSWPLHPDQFIRFSAGAGLGGGGTTGTFTVSSITSTFVTTPPCVDIMPETGSPIAVGYLPIFRRQIGDPTTSLDSYICTMESAAMALDWHTRNAVQVWGGELIPWCGKSEAEIIYGPDQGTSLSNAAQAWLHWGQYLESRSGQTWNDLLDCLDQGRAVILQGDYGEFSSAEKCSGFSGNHAILVLPDKTTGTEDYYAVGDPLCSAFKGIAMTSLRAYAEVFGAAVRGSSSPQQIMFAVTRPWAV